LLPGQRRSRQAGAGRHRGPRAVQGAGPAHRAPAGRRPAFRHGLRRLRHHRGNAGEAADGARHRRRRARIARARRADRQGTAQLPHELTTRRVPGTGPRVPRLPRRTRTPRTAPSRPEPEPMSTAVSSAATPASHDIHQDRILILDFGAQYTQLIARRIREIGVYCEIWAWDHDPAEIAAFGAKGIILSGGPESTTVEGSPRAPREVFDAGVPVLGICYGMQTMAVQLGGATEAADQREFGHAEVEVVRADALFAGLTDHPGAHRLDVWMSHGDHVSRVPPGFAVTAITERIPVAAMANAEKRWYGVQFHPEVTHTKQGTQLLRRFVVDICGCRTLWTAANIIEDQIARVREQVGSDEVILGLSGGVDSSVVAALLHRAIGDQLTCVFVDTGLLRWQEGDQVMATFAEHLGVKVIRVDAADRYFRALEGVADPEAKRKIIGNLFV